VTAVVTGASRGIGRAVALALAARGQRLSLLCKKSVGLDETVDRARQLGVSAESIPCDLADPAEVRSAASRVLETANAPTVVVNNAGVIHRGPIESATDAEWNEQLDVNLRAPFQITRAFLPAMRAARRGRFIFVGSITSTIGARHAAAYAASKWGLVGFMKSLAEELSDSGLSAMAVLPGSVDTEMLVGSGFPPRMTVEEVAKTITYFSLDAPVSHNGGVVEMFGT